MQDQNLATAATMRAVAGIRGMQLSGSWDLGERCEVTQPRWTTCLMPRIHTCPCLCLPRVCREHRGWPEPGVPGERAKAHPGLAGELLEAPGPVQRGPSLCLPPTNSFYTAQCDFRQIKASVFYSWAGILCSEAVLSNLSLHFYSSCHGTHLRRSVSGLTLPVGKLRLSVTK